MSTVEKLFFEIFERKNLIIEQARQKTDLFNQNLASKVLIEGIAPPSWLWSPNASDSKELNREEVISKLLRPQPQPSLRFSSAHYPLYNNPIVTGGNQEFSDGFFAEPCTSDRGFTGQGGPTVPVSSRNDPDACTLKSVPELDVRLTSPAHQTDKSVLTGQGGPTVSVSSRDDPDAFALKSVPELDVRFASPAHQTDELVSNEYNAPDQSLVRIQRSKSRQKALELRNSAKALTKSGLGREANEIVSSGIIMSIPSTEKTGHKDELLKLDMGCDSGEADSRNKDKDMDLYSGKTNKTSSKLDRLPDDCEKDAPYHIKPPKPAGPHSDFCQRGDEEKLDRAGSHDKGKETSVYGGRITRSKTSSKRQDYSSDSLKAADSSHHSRRKDNIMMDSVEDLPTDQALNDGVKSRESTLEDSKGQKEKGAVVSCPETNRSRGSSQQKVCEVEAPSSVKSALLVSEFNGELGLVKSPVDLIDRGTTTSSKTWSTNQEIFEPVSSSDTATCMSTFENLELIQNPSGGQIISPCHETHNTLDDRENADFSVENDLDSHDLVDQPVSSSINDAEQRDELESLVAELPPDCCVFMETEQLDFNEIHQSNLKNSSSRKKMPDNSLEKMVYSLPDPSALADKVVSGGINQVSLRKESHGKAEVSGDRDEVWRDFIDPDMSSQSNMVFGMNCENLEVLQNSDIMLSEIAGVSDIQIHPGKLNLEQVHEPLVEWQIEKVNRSSEDNTTNSSNSFKKTNAEPHDCLIEKMKLENSSPVIFDGIKPILAQESHNLLGICCEVSSPAEDSINQGNKHGENLSPARRFRPYSTESGSQLKIRKTEHHKTSSLAQESHNSSGIRCEVSTPVADSINQVTKHGENLSPERRFSPSNTESESQLKSRRSEHQKASSISSSPKNNSRQKSPASGCLKNIEVDIDTVLMDVEKTVDTEMCKEKDSVSTEGIEYSTRSQNVEVGFHYKEQKEQKDLLPGPSNERLGADLVLSSDEKKAMSSQSCYAAEMNILHVRSNLCDTTEPGDGQFGQLLCPLKEENDLNRKEQSTPVFEGSTVDKINPVSDGLAVETVDFDPLDLPSTSTIERASILAEICRAASMNEPLPQFSSDLTFQETLDSLQSSPAELLEQLNMSISLPSDADDDKQIESFNSLSNDFKGTFNERMPCSSTQHSWNSRSPIKKLSSQTGSSEMKLSSNPDQIGSSNSLVNDFKGAFDERMPCSSTPCSWNSRSPIEKLSSRTGSSEKLSSSNPELTCFPIEEDPSVSEDYKAVDDDLEEINSLIRPAFNDSMNVGSNQSPSVSAAQEDIFREDGPATNLRVTGTQRVPEKKSKNYSSAIKNQTFSIGTNLRKNGKESMKRRELSRNKTSLNRPEQKLSLRESRVNNIVSHVSSFLPLVKQKKPATPCAGKREVKVKALGAAEAARRIQEKREFDRQKRKEALKHKRERAEEERRMELEEKKKEAERKKKEADMMSKKRSREEEDRKEKEKKRMRVEVRQQQREIEDKKRAEKAEKEKQRRVKEEQIKKQQDMEIVRGGEKTKTKETSTGAAINYEEAKSPRNGDLIHKKNQEKSYEISPYKSSDDEDEEDDELRPKKRISSWASTSSLDMLITLQQEIDPYTIFPPSECFCNADEVLIPRRLQQKTGGRMNHVKKLQI